MGSSVVTRRPCCPWWLPGSWHVALLLASHFNLHKQTAYGFATVVIRLHTRSPPSWLLGNGCLGLCYLYSRLRFSHRRERLLTMSLPSWLLGQGLGFAQLLACGLVLCWCACLRLCHRRVWCLGLPRWLRGLWAWALVLCLVLRRWVVLGSLGLAWPSVCPRLFAVLVTYGLATVGVSCIPRFQHQVGYLVVLAWLCVRHAERTFPT